MRASTTKDFRSYYSSLGELKDEVREVVKLRGYTLNEDEYFTLQHVPYEMTERRTITIYTKNGNEAKKALHLAIYRMPSGNYELTAYIN